MSPKKQIDSSGKRVGIWLRVSTEEQAKGESPEHHEHRGRYYAESRGWSVVDVYHLEGVSGKSVIDHPEARLMLKDVERGHFTGLVFSKLARLGRNTKELLDFADYFQQRDADLISLQEAIDTSTPAGRLFFTLTAAARTVNEAGHRTRRGKPFMPNALEVMLRDPTSKGRHRANYVTYDPVKKNWKRKPESEWVYQDVEPILPAELWDACRHNEWLPGAFARARERDSKT